MNMTFVHESKTHFAVLLLVLLAATGCVTNPVTGKRELGLVSMEQQIAIGRQQYAPAQQMQGGQYKVDPGLTRYVSQVGQKVAAASGVDLPYEFVVLNNSVPNAWALPGGKIAINRGLLTELRNEAELAAVLGHEAAHAAARHGARAMERGMLLQGALVAAMIGARNSDYAGTVLGGAQMAAGLVTQKYGRDAERESDFYGTRYMAAAGYDPHAAVTLQETFMRLSEGRNTDWVQGLFSSHPPSAERVANNKTIVSKLKEEFPNARAFNSDQYQSAMRTVLGDADAYAAYDEAHKAAADKNYKGALAKVAQAVKKQPREAAFHGLQGDLRFKLKEFSQAEASYNNAVKYDDQYFAYYIGRGMTRKQLRKSALAKADLDNSLKLLPTAVAYNALGELAEAEGNKDAAVKYYEAASAAKGEAGRTAFNSMLRIDVPRQPSRYIKAQVVKDDKGRVVMRVSNGTDVPMVDVKLQVNLQWADGKQESFGSTVAKLGPRATQLVLVPNNGQPLLRANATAVSARAQL